MYLEGEVRAVVQVFDGQKQVEATTWVFYKKNKEVNKKWFAKYVPVEKKKRKAYELRHIPLKAIQ